MGNHVDLIFPRVRTHESEQATSYVAVALALEELSAAGSEGKAIAPESAASHGPAALLLPSHWFLAATVSRKGLPVRGYVSALKYRFEEHLPVAAEDLLIAFCEIDGERSFGVGLEISKVRSLSTTLRTRGVRVELVSSAALLALQSLIESGALLKVDALLLANSSGRSELDLFLIQNGEPYQWHTSSQGRGILRHALGQLAADRESVLTVYTAGLTASELVDLSTLGNIAFIQAESKAGLAPDLVPDAAIAILRGERRPLFGFQETEALSFDDRRHYRRALTAASLCLAALLTAVTISLFMVASRYERTAQVLEARQLAEFKNLLPGQPPPANIVSRLESESGKLNALSSSGTAGETRPSAMRILCDLGSHLPEAVRFRILQISIGPQSFTLEGQTRTHSDADALAASLRRLSTYTVEPPRTEQVNSETVAFTITGEIRASSVKSDRRPAGPNVDSGRVDQRAGR